MPELSAQMRPPIASTSCLQIYSPRPVPLTGPTTSRLRRTNLPKSNCSSLYLVELLYCTHHLHRNRPPVDLDILLGHHAHGEMALDMPAHRLPVDFIDAWHTTHHFINAIHQEPRNSIHHDFWRRAARKRDDRATQRHCFDHHHTKGDRKSTRLNSSHANISYAVFCLRKKKTRSA